MVTEKWHRNPFPSKESFFFFQEKIGMDSKQLTPHAGVILVIPTQPQY
jgi:hypothetical protein